jgi:hypothetical protein
VHSAATHLVIEQHHVDYRVGALLPVPRFAACQGDVGLKKTQSDQLVFRGGAGRPVAVAARLSATQHLRQHRQRLQADTEGNKGSFNRRILT